MFLSDLTYSNSSNTKFPPLRLRFANFLAPNCRRSGKGSRKASLHLRRRESVSARLGTPHRASRAPPASPPAAVTHPRIFQSPTFMQTCGDQGRLASQRLGKPPRQGQVRPLAPRRGPNARTHCNQGGGAPKAGGAEEGGSAER